jgi:hypothetical protein
MQDLKSKGRPAPPPASRGGLISSDATLIAQALSRQADLKTIHGAVQNALSLLIDRIAPNAPAQPKTFRSSRRGGRECMAHGKARCVGAALVEVRPGDSALADEAAGEKFAGCYKRN